MKHSNYVDNPWNIVSEDTSGSINSKKEKYDSRKTYFNYRIFFFLVDTFDLTTL